jgi:hypothetical protein
MTASLAALSTHNIHTRIQRLLRMLRRSNHIHDQYPGVMKALYDMWRRHSDGTDEQSCAFVDRDGYQVVELTVCIVMICFSRAAADLWQGQVDAEGQVGGVEVGLELVDYGAQLRGRVA